MLMKISTYKILIYSLIITDFKSKFNIFLKIKVLKDKNIFKKGNAVYFKINGIWLIF